MRLDWEELIPHAAHDARALVRKGLSNAQLLQRLLAPPPESEAARHLGAIVESQYDLNRLLVRLVALSEAGRTSSQAEEMTDLETLVLTVKIECRDAIQKAGASLTIQELPACSVPSRINAVLKELIDNSVRYTDPGRTPQIGLSAEVDGGKIRVRVSDNGSGIPPGYQNKLFHPFERLDPRSGFGLGLAISRGIIDALGGRIYHQTRETGARFAFELPVDVS